MSSVMKEKEPLTEKIKLLATSKRGFLLASAGGLIGGPFGLLLGPLILGIINITCRGKGKSVSRFRIWSYAGVVIAPITLITSIAILIGIGIILDPTFTGPSDGLLPQDIERSKELQQ
jgi:hypothetical protein